MTDISAFGGGRAGPSAWEVAQQAAIDAGQLPPTRDQFLAGLIGPPGLDFTTANNGEWSAGVTYPARIAVRRNGSLYRSLRTTTAEAPETTADAWSLVLPGVDLQLYNDLLAQVQASTEEASGAATAAQAAAETAADDARAEIAGLAAQAETAASLAAASATSAAAQAENIDAVRLAAEAAQAAAETAASVATVNADVYASTGAGLAATAVGDQFQVPVGDVITRYRHDAGGVATAVATYPSSTRSYTKGEADARYPAVANFQSFTTRTRTEIDGLAWRVTPYANDPRLTAVRVVGSELWVPALWVARPDSFGATSGSEGPYGVTPASGNYFVLPFPTIDDALGTARTYFVDMTADPRVVSSDAGIVAAYGSERLVIGWAHRGVFVSAVGLSVVYGLPPVEVDPVSRGNAPQVRAEALADALAVLPVADDTVGGLWVTASAGPIQIGGPFASGTAVLQAAGVQADCSHMPVGTSVVLNFPAGGTVYAGHGRTLAGQGSNHTATVPANGSVRVTRISPNASLGTVVEPLGGVTLTYSAGAEPVRAASVVLGGQSQLELGFSRGLPGAFARAVRTTPWMAGALNPDLFWIEGATGGSSILTASNNWWTTGGSDGPALTAFKAAVSAAVTAGQPVPEVVFWMQGEADAGALEAGAYTNVQYRDAIKALWGNIATFLTGLGASDPQFIVVQLGAWDVTDFRAGASAVRWAYQRAIAETANAHFGCDSYDIPRPIGDVHLNGMGHWHLGWRLARAWGNVVEGQANSLGPQIASATWRSAADFRAAVVTLPEGVQIPAGDLGDVASGPYPWGLQILSGANMTTEIPILRGVLDRAARTITLETGSNLTGARVTCAAGFAPDQRAGHRITDTAVHGRLRGLPLRTDLSAPLAAP